MTTTIAPIHTKKKARGEPRFSFAELADAARMTERDAGAMLRLSGSAVAQLRAHGMTIDQADRYAIRLGLHPSEVWSNWYTLAA